VADNLTLLSEGRMSAILNGRATDQEARQIALLPALLAALKDLLREHPIPMSHCGISSDCPHHRFYGGGGPGHPGIDRFASARAALRAAEVEQVARG
jgi:hypothetical protein